jgi:hypothetical protein
MAGSDKVKISNRAEGHSETRPGVGEIRLKSPPVPMSDAFRNCGLYLRKNYGNYVVT